MTNGATPSIDLNADVGEGGGHDDEIMRFISSANIACGGHAGDPATMATTITLARAHGVAIGAHPGHADRKHFGRREIDVTPEDAAALVLEQVAGLAVIAGESPSHVKLHGGLYHQVARERSLAAAVTAAIAARWPGIVLVAPVGSLLVEVGRGQGMRVSVEAFIDRAYASDGTLVPRSQPAASITDPNEAAARAVRIARDRTVETIDGTVLRIEPDTLCLHGDGADPVGMASAVRRALHEAGIRVRR